MRASTHVNTRRQTKCFQDAVSRLNTRSETKCPYSHKMFWRCCFTMNGNRGRDIGKMFFMFSTARFQPFQFCMFSTGRIWHNFCRWKPTCSFRMVSIYTNKEVAKYPSSLRTKCPSINLRRRPNFAWVVVAADFSRATSVRRRWLVGEGKFEFRSVRGIRPRIRISYDLEGWSMFILFCSVWTTTSKSMYIILFYVFYA